MTVLRLGILNRSMHQTLRGLMILVVRLRELSLNIIAHLLDILIRHPQSARP